MARPALRPHPRCGCRGRQGLTHLGLLLGAPIARAHGAVSGFGPLEGGWRDAESPLHPLHPPGRRHVPAHARARGPVALGDSVIGVGPCAESAAGRRSGVHGRGPQGLSLGSPPTVPGKETFK